MIQAPGAPGVAARLAQIGAALALLVAGSADAQGLNLNKDSGQPVEINADQGIEWRRDDNVYIARGNASAKQGDVTVHADTLTAHYHPVEGGGTDIYQLDAIGNVVINSANGTASGDNGVYDVGNALMVLKGRALKMVSEDYTVTARDSLEYWDNKQMAVARGNAVVVNEDKRLSGSIVTAYFTPSGSQSESRSESGGNGSGQGKKPGGQNKSQKSGGTDGGDQQQKIRRIEAFENVRVSSPGQIAVANTGVYDVESGIATLYGSVKITREDNQLNGEYGEVNLNTGVSRMLSGPPGSTGPQPVHGLFSPKKKPEMTSPSGSSAAQAPVQAPVKAPSQPAAARLVPTQAPSPAP